MNVKQVTGPLFLPRAIISTVLVEVHKRKLPTKYQRPGFFIFRQEEFFSFAYRNLCNFYLSIKKIKVNQRLSFFQDLINYNPSPIPFHNVCLYVCQFVVLWNFAYHNYAVIEE